jgi:hypothetical protein
VTPGPPGPVMGGRVRVVRVVGMPGRLRDGRPPLPPPGTDVLRGFPLPGVVDEDPEPPGGE